MDAVHWHDKNFSKNWKTMLYMTISFTSRQLSNISKHKLLMVIESLWRKFFTVVIIFIYSRNFTIIKMLFLKDLTKATLTKIQKFNYN